MRFVEDHEVVGGEQRAAADEIEEEQRVVDDDDVGEARGVALLEEKAVGEARAVLADAVVGVERLPVVGSRGEVQFGAIARLGALGPRPQPLERERGRDQPRRALLLELRLAQVVVAAFEQHDARVDAEGARDERDVLADELLLQRDRSGRDDHTGARAQRRDEVRERLADAGSGLDDRVHVLEKAALHETRHAHLAFARLVAGERACDRPAGCEHLVDGVHSRGSRFSSGGASISSCGPASGGLSMVSTPVSGSGRGSGRCTIVSTLGSASGAKAYAYARVRARDGTAKSTSPARNTVISPPTWAAAEMFGIA